MLPPPALATAPEGVLAIQLLGDFRVSVGERVIEATAWHSHKSQSVLKVLAVTPEHRLHREHLMDLLWSDLASEAATNNLHKALYAARRVLEPGLGRNSASAYLHLRGQLVVLAPPGRLWIDVEEFEAATARARRERDPALYAQALRLYTGELLPEDCYEDWAAGCRERLQTLHLALLMEQARLQEQRGELDAAIEALRVVVQRDAVHEEAHCQLMRLLVQGGQRHQALRQYQVLRQALRTELEAEPDTATQALYRHILEGRGGAGGRAGWEARPVRLVPPVLSAGVAQPVHQLVFAPIAPSAYLAAPHPADRP